MRQITRKKLPHGKVPFAEMRDVSARDAVMKLNENIIALKKQVAELQDAVIELQKK